MVKHEPAVLPPAVARDGHVDRPEPSAGETPELRAGPVIEQRALVTRENAGHPQPVLRQLRVADRIDAAVNDMKPSVLHAQIDGAWREAEGPELSTSNNAVLPRRQLRDPHVGW